jgi:hypothetical protein
MQLLNTIRDSVKSRIVSHIPLPLIDRADEVIE